MSFNRIPYDISTYKHNLAQIIGTGIYQLTRPDNQRVPILPKDPRFHAQSSGVSISKNTSMIDNESELLGIARNLSGSPDRQYMPTNNFNLHCGAQTGKVKSGCGKYDKVCVYNNQILHFDDNGLFTEDCRLSNPPSNNRGTGFNRWEWLPIDPQDRVIEEFDFQINTKLLSKDNHRACIPTPINQTNLLPQPTNNPICETINSSCEAPTYPPSVSWQDASVISRY